MAEFDGQNYFTVDMAGTAIGAPGSLILHCEAPYEADKELCVYENGVSNYEGSYESRLRSVSRALMVGGVEFEPWEAPFRNASADLVSLQFSIEELDVEVRDLAAPLLSQLKAILESAREPRVERYDAELQEAVNYEQGRSELWVKLREAGDPEKVDNLLIRYRVARLLGFRLGRTEEGERIYPILEGSRGDRGLWLGKSSLYLAASR